MEREERGGKGGKRGKKGGIRFFLEAFWYFDKFKRTFYFFDV